jgi:hypothetical protein
VLVSRNSPVILSLSIVEDASVLNPGALNTFAVRSEIVVVAKLVVPVAVNDPVVIDPLVTVPNTAFTALNTVVKKLVAVNVVAEALVTLRFEIVVVANVDVPSTVRLPLVEALPFAYVTKFKFSAHADPFQNSVELVAVPPPIVPLTDVQ